jgi:YggT family protein
MFVTVIDWIFRLLIFVVVVDIVLSYFMDRYHPVRQALDRVVNPLLAPIRKVMPTTGNLDLSPMVLIFILWIVEQVVLSLFRR